MKIHLKVHRPPLSTLKPTYFEITIEGFLQSVFYNNGVEEYLTKAKPINKK
jgi:hypothetical protein